MNVPSLGPGLPVDSRALTVPPPGKANSQRSSVTGMLGHTARQMADDWLVRFRRLKSDWSSQRSRQGGLRDFGRVFFVGFYCNS